MQNPIQHLDRIVCFGDSITEGFDLPVTHHWPKVMVDELSARGFAVGEVYARGVGGNTAAMGMDRIDTHLGPLLPGMVLLEFGINDAYVNPWASAPRSSLDQFVAQLQAMIVYIRSKGGVPVLLNNHPLLAHADRHQQGNGRSIVENLGPYRVAARVLAKQETVPFVDLDSALGQEFLAALHPDGIHLTPASSLLYGKAVGSELAGLLAKNLPKQNL